MTIGAVVSDGIVTNVIVIDDTSAPLNLGSDGSLVVLSDGSGVAIGWSYDGAEFHAPASEISIAIAKEDQAARIDVSYGFAVQQSVAFKTVAGVSQMFQADIASQTILSQATQGYQIAGSVPTNFFWKAADNTLVPFTLADLEGLYLAMLAQGWTAFQKRAALKAEIDAATSVAAVQAVAWD